MGKQQRRTLRDIADKLNVSVNTVSRGLRGKSDVSEETRTRILAEAERIGYVPNPYARSLVLGSRGMIGLVITNVSNPFYAEMISEIELRATESNYTVVLLLSEESIEREIAVADTVLQSGLDGVLVVPVKDEKSPWSTFGQKRFPIVFINRTAAGNAISGSFVGIDNRHGAYAATSHVIKNGARSAILLEEDLPISTIDQRIAGFRAAIEDHGLPFDDTSIVTVPTRRTNRSALPWTANDAYRISGDILDRGHIPDAFVVGNDYFALGLYRALRERKISTPSEVMVAGYGDYPFSEFLSPTLTTVRLPAREVGKMAVEMLFAQIRGDKVDSQATKYVLPELVIRDSTRLH